MDKLVGSAAEAVGDVPPGTSLAVGGFGLCGIPSVLIAGTNCVTTDAVAMSVMGYDPMADRGTPPFEDCDSTLRLAEAHGVGTRDLKRIVVVGTPVEQARFSFAEIRRARKVG